MTRTHTDSHAPRNIVLLRALPCVLEVAALPLGSGCFGGSVCDDARGTLDHCGITAPIAPDGAECASETEHVARCITEEPDSACSYFRNPSGGTSRAFAECLADTSLGDPGSDGGPSPLPTSSNGGSTDGALRVRLVAREIPDDPRFGPGWSFSVEVTNEGEPHAVNLGIGLFDLETNRAHVLRPSSSESTCPEIGLAIGGSGSCQLRFDALPAESPSTVHLNGSDGRRASAAVKAIEGTFANCSDGVDNDENGFTDCGDRACCSIRRDCPADSYCGARTSTPESDPAACSDGRDNDLDHYIDCEDRSCCTLFLDGLIACDPSTYCGRS